MAKVTRSHLTSLSDSLRAAVNIWGPVPAEKLLDSFCMGYFELIAFPSFVYSPTARSLFSDIFISSQVHTGRSLDCHLHLCAFVHPQTWERWKLRVPRYRLLSTLSPGLTVDVPLCCRCGPDPQRRLKDGYTGEV